MNILDLINKVEQLNTDQVSEDSMDQVSSQLADRQKDQLFEGKNSNGEKIGRYRSPAYAAKKYSMNPVPGYGVPDLRLTGDFYRNVYAETRGDKVIIDSTDEKTQKLVDKYGEEIFGLTPATKKEFIEEDLRPVFMVNIKKLLGFGL